MYDFNLTFDQFNAFLLNKNIHFLKKYFEQYCMSNIIDTRQKDDFHEFCSFWRRQ